MSRKQFILLLLVFSSLALGSWCCSSSDSADSPGGGDGEASEEGDTAASPGGDAADTSGPGADDGGTGTDGDIHGGPGDDDGAADGDIPGDADGDADGMADEDYEASGRSCRFPTDCPNREDCVDEQCVPAKSCTQPEDCLPEQMCWVADKTDRVGHCRYFCTTDMDCSSDGQCMNGLCEIYAPVPAGDPPPKHSEWEGRLHAQFAEGELDSPMTICVVGYGSGMGVNGPYQESLGGADSVYDRLYIKALTLDNGEERVVFVTLPMIFPTDFLVTGIIKRVIELGGPDLRNNLVLNGSHTHAGPGGFWNILPDLKFGALGMGEFSWESYQRAVNSIARVVYEAQQDLKPAAFGYAINEDFDPDDLINYDRRSNNDDFKDPRLIVWRIDDMSDPDKPEPWVITLNYATHGTTQGHRDSTLSNDAPGGAQNMTQLLFEREFGKKINTMFFNGMAGDISQGGKDLGHKHTQQMQLIGHRVYSYVMDLFDEIEANGLDEVVDLHIVSKRVPIDRDEIGYSDNEFYSDGVSFGEIKEGPLRFGAFQCGLLTTPMEENLDLYVYDDSGELIKSSEYLDAEGESVQFTPESSGTFYIKVVGLDGCMNDYSLSVTREGGRSSHSRCIDARCGGACGSCSLKSQMVPSECSDDDYDLNGNNNDTRDEALGIETDTLYEDLQICPFDDDWFKVDLETGRKVLVAINFHQDHEAYNSNTKIHDGNLGCPLIMEILNRGPMPQFGKTRFTSILINGLYLAGLPGESTSRMGLDTVNEIKSVTDFEDVVVFGYTNDHHFYICTEDDWFQGGYLTTMTIWGFKFGPFLIEHLKKLAVAVSQGREAEEASVNEFPNMKPLNYNDLPNDTRVPDYVDPEIIGVHADNERSFHPKNTVKMQEQAKFAWIGADPGVDFPRCYLERKEGRKWVQVMRPENVGRVYDDRYYEMRLNYANDAFNNPNDENADPNNYWTLVWEETYNFPIGTYRFHVEGNYYDGSRDFFDKENGIKDYTIYSDAFRILPTRFDIQAPGVADGELRAFLRYARAVGNDDGVHDFDTFQNEALLLHDPTVEYYAGARAVADESKTTVIVTVLDENSDEVATIEDGTLTEGIGTVYYVASRNGGVETIGQINKDRPVTVYTATLPALDPGDYTARISVTDIWDNSGELDYPFTVE